MKKILVTGASGFIGRNTLPFIKAKDLEVYGTYYPDHHEDDDVHWLSSDLLDKSAIDNTMRTVSPDILLHLAWNIEPSNYNSNVNLDWFQVGVDLLTAFKNVGGKRVIMVGSGMEYDWSYGVCSEHRTPCKSSTTYGTSKNLLYEYGKLFCKQHGLSFSWPRIFFTYGLHENVNRLVPHVISQLMKNEEALIRSRSLYRDYIYVKDIGYILSELIESDFEGAVNVGTGKPSRLGDMVDFIAEFLGRKELIHYDVEMTDEPKIVVADTEILTRELGISSFNSFEEGLSETIEMWLETSDVT